MQNHFLLAIVNSDSCSIVFDRLMYSSNRNKENIQSRFRCHILPKIYENLFGKHIIYFWYACFSENTYICISGMRTFLTYLYTSNMAGAQLRERREGAGGSSPTLRISSRKNSRIFPCGAFFSGVFDKMFIKVP